MAANYYKYNANMNDRTYFTSVIADSSGRTKRYFSNVESEIYFGDKEMDDIYQFEFGIDEKILPIYGYNCYYSSELVSGQRIVQGQFVVNYTDTKMIQNTLSNIDDSVYDQVYSEDYVPGGDLHHAIYNKSFDIMIGYGYYDIKDKQTYNATSQTIIGAKISGMHKVLDTTGQPILEVFSFVAKDFIEENIIESNTNNDNNSNTNNDKNTSTLKYPYICSDYYNANEVAKNTKTAKTNNSEHLIHNIVYNSGYITMQVTLDEDKTVVIDDAKATLEISESIDDNTVIPLMNFTSSGRSNAQIRLEEKYNSIFKKRQEKGKHKIRCTVRYKVKVTKNGKSSTFDVVYSNANIYL